MKSEKQIRTKAQNQNQFSIKDDSTRTIQLAGKVQSKNVEPKKRTSSTILFGKRGEGGRLCKGPPGCPHPPRIVPDHPPDDQNNENQFIILIIK